MKSIFVGNLPFGASEDEVRELFSAYGEVSKVTFVMDRETGRFRGFGFIEMEPSGADAAIEALDGKDFGGRTLRVAEARQRTPR
ncbi:MAG: RNA-binding protein [Desulfovibrionaceae bacterium]|nr:RNA-binding protein [Desulfovibrionaceae bacterium]